MPIRPGRPKIRVRGTTRIPKILLADPHETMRDLTVANAAAKKAERSGFPFEGPTHFELFTETENAIEVPRNYRPDLVPGLTRDKDYTVSIEVERPIPYEAFTDAYHGWLGDDNVGLGPNQWQPYNQQPAFDALVEPMGWPHGKMLALRPGGGKTCIAMKALHHRNVHTLWVTMSTVLIDQFYRDAEKWLGLTKEEIGHVQGKEERWENYGLTVAMLHSLALKDYPQEFYDHFDLIIFDEGDVLKAESFSEVAPRFRGERWILTGTPNRADGMDVLYKMHVGAACFTDLEFDLEPKCHFIYTGTPRKGNVKLGGYNSRTGKREIHYAASAGLLMQDEDRKDFLVDTVAGLARQGRTVLVLGASVEGLALSFADAKRKMPEIPQGLIHGKVAKKKRPAIIESSQVLWASTQLAYRGLDKPAFDTLVVSSLASVQDALWRQGVGRVLRYMDGKHEPLVVTLVDEEIEEVLGMCTKLAKLFRKWGWPLSGEADEMIKEANRKARERRRR